MSTEMDITFYYLIFQSNIATDYVYYWMDGKPIKQVMRVENFLELALNKHSGKLYSQVYDACRSCSFFMWNAVDERIIHLFQKIEKDESKIYKNSINQEFKEFKKNPQYSSQEAIAMKAEKKLDLIDSLGFERPSQEYVSGLYSSLSAHNNSSSLLSKVGEFFKKKH